MSWNSRVLVVQKTGWGKSFVYFIATKLLREAGRGPALLISPLLALMLGLAVGIDYALFITSRHRDQLRDGMDPEESVSRAVATAGSAVVFAGMTVMIALVGLSVAGIPFLSIMGVAAAVGVAIAVLIGAAVNAAFDSVFPARRPGWPRRALAAGLRLVARRGR